MYLTPGTFVEPRELRGVSLLISPCVPGAAEVGSVRLNAPVLRLFLRSCFKPTSLPYHLTEGRNIQRGSLWVLEKIQLHVVGVRVEILEGVKRFSNTHGTVQIARVHEIPVVSMYLREVHAIKVLPGIGSIRGVNLS